MPERPTTERQLRADGAHDEWLSDDVVVDFPSMSGIVEQMRATFFGTDDDAAATHRAEVTLTPREADEGVRVPFDLTVRHTCPVCGGRGEVWAESCGVCAGSGQGLLPHQFQLRVPAGVRDGTRLTYSVTPPFSATTHLEVRIAIP
jgi:hypothetical protein